jgi:hypothetical protein
MVPIDLIFRCSIIIETETDYLEIHQYDGKSALIKLNKNGRPDIFGRLKKPIAETHKQ